MSELVSLSGNDGRTKSLAALTDIHYEKNPLMSDHKHWICRTNLSSEVALSIIFDVWFSQYVIVAWNGLLWGEKKMKKLYFNLTLRYDSPDKWWGGSHSLLGTGRPSREKWGRWDWGTTQFKLSNHYCAYFTFISRHGWVWIPGEPLLSCQPWFLLAPAH